MMDLTPLDVRKKQGDFRRALRGYDADAVDAFLEQVADRFEELVRENVGLRERATQLSRAVESYRERERAMNEALISAQQLREETRTQAAREAELTVREAQAEAQRIVDEARRQLASVEGAMGRVQTQRRNYLRAFRSLLERHLDEISQEEDRLRALLPIASVATARPQRSRENPAWLAVLDGPSSGNSG